MLFLYYIVPLVQVEAEEVEKGLVIILVFLGQQVLAEEAEEQEVLVG